MFRTTIAKLAGVTVVVCALVVAPQAFAVYGDTSDAQTGALDPTIAAAVASHQASVAAADLRSPDTLDASVDAHKALLLRSQALNKKYHLGSYGRNTAQTAQTVQIAHSEASSPRCPCNVGLPGGPTIAANAGTKSNDRSWGWEAHLGMNAGVLQAQVTQPSFKNRFTRGD
jgi:hypothetical protein